ncbi:MAG: hypothetical protein ABIJ61_05595 [bacterium]
MSTRVICLLMVIISAVWVGESRGADAASGEDSTSAGALSIYVDCDGCDFDYLKEELSFVNFVRDRQFADVHLLVTSQETGGGGREYEIEVIGKRSFAGLADTVDFLTTESDTDDILRTKMAHSMKLALVRYVLRTPQAEHLQLDYDRPAVVAETIDKWNHWVFELSLSSWLNGEEGYRSLSLSSDIEARRVTEKSRVELGIWAYYDESKFDYGDFRTLSISRSQELYGNYVWGLTDHWSLDFYSETYSSKYSNLKLRLWNAPGIEYNIFPYQESNRRELRFVGRIPAIYAEYDEETIYGKTSEWLFRCQLSVTLGMIEPWGSAGVSLYGSSYLHDFQKNRLQLYGDISLRIIEGLSLELSSSYTRVRDQLALRRGDASEEEILLRQHELETKYTYYVSVGISYSFGSIYSSILNPRFGG